MKSKYSISLKHIDTQINIMVNKSHDVDSILGELKNKIIKFNNILSNLDIEKDMIRYNFISTHIDVCNKRVEDFNFIKYLKFNFVEYSEYKLDKLFRLINLRDKLYPFDKIC
jgi:hypothetical protein